MKKEFLCFRLFVSEMIVLNSCVDWFRERKPFAVVVIKR